MSETGNGTGNKTRNENGNENGNINIKMLLDEVNTLVNTPIRKQNMKVPQEAVVQVVGQLERAIQKTSGRLQASLDNADSLRNKLASKETELSSTQRRITELEEEHKIALAAAETGSSGKMSELAAAHQKAINFKNANKERMKANLNDRITSIESELASERKNFTTLQSEKLSLENKKQGLEGEIKEYKSKLSEAVKAIQKLKEKVKNYNKSYKILEDQISQIYGKYSNNSGVLTTNTNKIIKKATGMNLRRTEEVAGGEDVGSTGETLGVVNTSSTEPILGGKKKRVTLKRKSASKKKSVSKSTKSKKSTKTKKVSKKRV